MIWRKIVLFRRMRPLAAGVGGYNLVVCASKFCHRRPTKRHPPICGRWNQEMIHFYSKQSAFTNRNLRFDVRNFALHLFIGSSECFDGLNPFDNDFRTIHAIGFAWAFRIHESERQALDFKPGIYSRKHKTLRRSPNEKPEILRAQTATDSLETSILRKVHHNYYP